MEEWTDMNVVVYHGHSSARQVMRDYEWHYTSASGKPVKSCHKFNVLVTTYEMVLADAAILKLIKWAYLIVDEAHRLKNTKSRLIQALRTFSFGHCTLLTGTPLQNNVTELWSLLNFMDPKRFPSLKRFLDQFGNIEDTVTLKALQEILLPRMLRRKKDDVEKSLTPKEVREDSELLAFFFF